MKEEVLVNRVQSLVENYDHTQPFSIYLRGYFKANPKMGSTDRRKTREWCYNFFRLGKSVSKFSFRERLRIACFLCGTEEDSYWKNISKGSDFESLPVNVNVEEKISQVKRIYNDFLEEELFPMRDHLTNQIPVVEWCKSFLKQPRVWVRIQNNKQAQVIEEIENLQIKFEKHSDNILSFTSATKLDALKTFEKGFFEIQDINSQRTGDYFRPSDDERWWDVCCGSGGKSLLLMEMAKNLNVFASDARSTILSAYSARMKKAGHSNFDTQVIDFRERMKSLNLHQFNGIIADVPCSGSGTWSRTPEWNQVDLKEKLMQFYIPVQRKIILACHEYLKKGSPLIYITCSVFKEENEENIGYFESSFPLYLEKYEYLKGYNDGADTLFAARFIKK